VREETDEHADDECNALLVQYGTVAGAPPSLSGYHVTWEGRRRGDATERFVLYVKDRPS